MEFGLGVVLVPQGVLLPTWRCKLDMFWDGNSKNKHKSLLRSACALFLLFLSFYLLPPSLFSSLPPPLWSGGKGIFITLIRSPVLGWPFEVWLPAPSVQERILGTAGFLLLFPCIYKLASFSFLFFCFICLCFPSLIKPVSFWQVLPHLWSLSLIYFSSPFSQCDHSLFSTVPHPFYPSFLPSFICLLGFFPYRLVLTHVFCSFWDVP